MNKWSWIAVLLLAGFSLGSSCRDPKQDWNDRNPRKAAIVPVSSGSNQPAATAPSDQSDQSIKSSVLVVAGEPIEVQDVLEDAGQILAGLGPQQTRSSFIQAALPIVRQSLQRQVGEILLYKEAVSNLNLSSDKEKRISEAVDNILQERVAQLSAGNRVEFERQVIASGRTLDGLKKNIRRALLVHQYLRDKFEKKIIITRAQLQDYYQEHLAEYSSPGRVELQVLRVSYRRFLPDPQNPARASVEDKRSAHDAARQVLETALHELQEQPATRPVTTTQPQTEDAMAPFMQAARPSFDKVAQAYSDDPAASRGGAYGLVSAADLGDRELAGLVFNLTPGGAGDVKLAGHTRHGPLESESGYYLIQTGNVEPANVKPFRAVQTDIEKILRERILKRLQEDYLDGLFNRSGIDPAQVDNFAQTVLSKLLQARPRS